MDGAISVSRPFYKPFITKTAVLTTLLLVTIALIALTELGCRRIPGHPGVGDVGDRATQLASKTLNGTSLLERQDGTITYIPSIPSSTVNDQFSDPSPIGAKPTAPSPADSYPPSVFLTSTDPGLILGSQVTPTLTTIDPGLILGPQVTPTPPIVSTSTDPGLILSSQVTLTPPPVAGTPTYSGGLITPSLFVPIPSLIPSISNEVSVPITDASSPTLVLVSGQLSTQYATSLATNTDGSPLPILTTNFDKTPVVTPVATATGSQTFTRTPALTVVGGNTYATVGNENQATATISSISPTSTFVNSTGTYLAWSNGGITHFPQITLIQYISVAFVPLVVAGIYSIPWCILDGTIRKMEVFYQLHQPGGACGTSSLCLDYGSSPLITMPFKTLFRGHFIPLASSLISLSILALSPLASEAFFVSLGTGCYVNTKEFCHASWGVYPLLVRIIQGILSLVAVLLILLILLNSRRSSGVYSEPLSIVGLGVLLPKSSLLHQLSMLDSRIGNRELTRALQKRRFALSWFTARDGTPSYGIIPLDDVSEGTFPSFGRKPRYHSVSTNEVNWNEHIQENEFYRPEPIPQPSKIWQIIKEKTLLVVAFLVFGGLLAMISYYHWTGAASGFEKFMDSTGFGVRFMMSIIGVAVKLLWAKIDTNFRKIAPYNHLLKGASPAQDSILVPAWQTPVLGIIPSLRRRQYLTTILCTIALPAEFLPLFLANIPFSFGTTKLAYNICNFFSMAILIIMTLTAIVLIFRKPSGASTLPRTPDTVASVAVYLAGKEDGCLVDSLEGLSVAGKKERDRVVGDMGKVYSLGFVDDERREFRIDDDLRVRSLWEAS